MNSLHNRWSNLFAVLVCTLIASMPAAAAEGNVADDGLILAVVYVCILGGLAVIVAGITEKLVIYYDGVDLAWSAAPLFLVPLIFYLAGMAGEAQAGTATMGTSILVILGVLLMVYSLKRTIGYAIVDNRSIPLGTLVGCCKLLGAWLIVILMFGQVAIIMDQKSKRKSMFRAVLLVGFLTWLTRKLINGEAVYKKQGRPLR